MQLIDNSTVPMHIIIITHLIEHLCIDAKINRPIGQSKCSSMISIGYISMLQSLSYVLFKTRLVA